LSDRLASNPTKLIYLLLILHNWFLIRFSISLDNRLKMNFHIIIIDFLLLNIKSLSSLETYLQSYKICNILQIIKLFLILIIFILLKNLLRLAIINNINLISYNKSCPLVFIFISAFLLFFLFDFFVINYHISILSLL
jgi:hypothetical protein